MNFCNSSQILCCILSLYCSVSALANPKSPDVVEGAALASEESWGHKLWGTPAAPQINIGMWTAHPLGNDPIHNNEVISMTYKGFTAGTLLNSFYRRSYTFAIHRNVIEKNLDNQIDYTVGYRLGLIYGYSSEETRRLIGINSPLVPYPQVIAAIDWRRLGIEFSWTFVVVSAGFYIRL